MVKKDMDISVNGDGPSVRFRIGLFAIIQVVVVLVTFAAAMKVTQAQVEDLRTQQGIIEGKLDDVISSQRRTEAVLDALREEIRYYREKLDRHIDRDRSGQ